MRILEIRLQNLNALTGRWCLDFRHPAFAEDGIFAVTGPTGAGKSTILDALCLALYGRTPRLGKITKENNEIMSRHSGECFAEVTFATQKGLFRCHWSQQRARKRQDGKLQQPRHELVDAASNTVLAAKLGDVAEQVAAATGMDFDRFTRTILLAQGGFAAFLQASPAKRAEVLEQITGTAIYSEISKQVHLRAQAEQDRLKTLQAQAEAVSLLSPEEEEALDRQLHAGQADEATLTQTHTATEQALAWRKTLETLRADLQSLDEQHTRLAEDQAAFQPKQARLLEAERAAALAGPASQLEAVQAQQNKDVSALTDARARLPHLAKTAAQSAGAARTARTALTQAQEQRDAAQPLLDEVRQLDRQCAEGRAALKQAEEALAEAAAKSAAQKQLQQQTAEQEARAQAALTRIRAELEARAADARLVGELTGLEARLRHLGDQEQELARKTKVCAKAEQALVQARKTLDQWRTDRADQQSRHKTAQQERAAGAEALDRLLAGRPLAEFRRDRDHLLEKRELLRTIASLAEHRTRLADGAPCPLCGATVHPYAQGNAPQPDALDQEIADLTTLIASAEQQEAVCTRLVQAEQRAEQALHAALAKEEAAEQALVPAEQGQTAAAAEREALAAALATSRTEVLALLAPLGFADQKSLPKNPSRLVQDLRDRQAAWLALQEAETARTKEIADLSAELGRLDAALAAQNEALTEKTTQATALRQTLAEREAQRQALFADQDPERVAASLTKACAKAESGLRSVEKKQQDQQQEWRALRERIRTLEKAAAERAPDLACLQGEFNAALDRAGFPDAAAFRAALLSDADRAALLEESRRLDERRAGLAAMRADRSIHLAKEEARNLDPAPLAELEARQAAEADRLAEIREALAGLKLRLADNAKAKETARARREALSAQEQECSRWLALHELIGSADGKKFRNFAQGLTFDLLIHQANRQLACLSDRYLLVQDAREPLAPAVIDNYQAGEIRSAKNLSGGESFIVSLALALGLSSMAGRSVRVDSLFLDEGFGSLDEDSLETALNTLANLRREGKLIGVISHVAAIRERIPTRIRVRPASGGRSRITGPGCGEEA